MRVALIRVPFYALFETEAKCGNIPVGLCHLASALEQRGHEVSIVDGDAMFHRHFMRVDGMSLPHLTNQNYEKYKEVVLNPDHEVWSTLARTAIATSPDVVGITSYTTNFTAVCHVTRLIKRDAGVPVVLGGIHPTSLPEMSLHESGADYCVVGEGEGTFATLVDALASRTNVRHIPGLAYRDALGLHVNGTSPLVDDLDSLPLPARHLLDRDMYTKEAFGYMFSSRGCPYKCEFCDSKSVWTRKVRYRSIGNIVDEIEGVVQTYGSSAVRFNDDIFPMRRDRMKAFAEEVRRRSLKFNYRCGVRLDMVRDDILEYLRESGCNHLSLGVESGSQRILNTISKGITIDDIRAIHARLKSFGFKTTLFFILGHPTETLDEMKQTLDLMWELEADLPSLSMMTPYPGTDIYAKYVTKPSYNWWEYFHHGRVFANVSAVDDITLNELYQNALQAIDAKKAGSNISPDQLIYVASATKATLDECPT